jgi:hypothetical protein
MDLTHAEVLDSTTNLAVVQLPGRQFPGSVIQGDSLNALLSALRDIQQLARSAAPKSRELQDEIKFLVDGLQERLSHYEAVLAARGIERPYYNPP